MKRANNKQLATEIHKQSEFYVDMKRKIFISAFAVFVLSGIITAAGDDSTKIFETGNKRILVKDNDLKQRTEVQVYEKYNNRDSTFYEQVFEGHYRDGKSNEQRKYLATIDIPMPQQRRWKSSRFYAHWAGFGVGFAGFEERGDYNDFSFSASKSLEYTFNIFEKTIPISKYYKWAVVTGFGFRWTRYRVKGNYHFQEIDDYTELIHAPENITYSKSVLGITTLNFPLLLEWQAFNGKLFFSGGVVGSIKSWSSSYIEYQDNNGRRRKTEKEKIDRGMTLRPVTMDILLQAGTRGFGAYARYSPISIFENKKGPELYPLSFGLMLHF